ncbi:MAG TPA: exodeoxyribonuclease VII large subunit [Candidatus Saccharimonadales bacterium]|nr:exodeoxyribonuclease VII large subunit [Candidatus Saccharimonadales bacterium]
MEKQIYSVSDLISVVNQTLEFAYPTVIVEGEVASFKVSKNKFVFFDIKDNDGVIGCFMMIYSLRIPLEDGMKVRLIAQPKLTPWGKFSLSVREVLPVGEGTIKRAFEILKAKLQSEGLFDSSRKRILPKIPGRVGVIASSESSGYADFIKIINHRWRGIQIEVADVQVQGVGAGQQIIKAIDYFNQQPNLVEVLVIIRGGGSAEDLAVFNEEPLVRTIAASRIPTLVGVGHETDTSLCDLVADLRAATPSNAAQLLTPDREAVLRELSQREQRFLSHIQSSLQAKKLRALQAVGLMFSSIDQTLELRMHQLQMASRLLNQVNPSAVLRRGYSLVRQNGALLKSGLKLKKGDELVIELSDTIINVGVQDVKKS